MRNTTYVPRILDISKHLKVTTVLLFGPRQTGKSTFVRHELGPRIAASYDLLDQGLLLRLMADPTMMRKEIELKRLRECIVCVDEVQKCPALLDEVQLLMEQRRIRFLLMGSSTRKLRRAGTNLLGGRGRDRRMHPFVYPELKSHGFTLERAFNRGLIPSHFLSDDPEEDLSSYVGRYLTEEIAAEGLSRRLLPFARFLQVAAASNSQLVNFTAIASDAQVPRQTVQQWFQLLQDTLVGSLLPPFTGTLKRKSIGTPKFYFFDMGVVRALRQLPPVGPKSHEFGEFFEHFLFLELRAWVDYSKPAVPLEFWRSKSGYEVDFILNREVAIEAKAAPRVSDKHLRSLRALREERKIRRFILACREERPRLEDGIEIWPWHEFLDQLWDGAVL